MGLATPLALLGLATLVLPILAHRLQRRDLVPVPLPTFHLLERAKSHKRRSRGLADWLLLALRMGILALATIALGAPYVTARLTFGDGTVASVAIVIDDSMSMMASTGTSSHLERAIDRAHEALGSLPQGSEVALVAAGAPARRLLPRTDDLLRARQTLEGLPRASLRATELQQGVDLALSELAGGRHDARRMLVLSDFAVHTKLGPDTLSPPGIDVQLERTGDGSSVTNLFFTSVTALADPTIEGQTSIALELRAVGSPPPSVPVTIVNAAREMARIEVPLVDGHGRTSVHVPTPDRQMDPTALLRIDAEDALDADNVAGVLLRRSNAMHVMLVNGDPHPTSHDDELYYARHAMRLEPSAEMPLTMRTVDASAFANYDLSLVDVVIMANVPAPNERIAGRLATFVARGGGLIFTAGDKVRPRAYNDRLGELLPCRLRAASRAKDMRFHEPDPGSSIFPHGLAGLAEARTQRRLVVESEHQVELAFADGSAAIVSKPLGRGRVLLLTTTLDDDWADLPLRPGYLPLLSGLVRSASSAGAAPPVENATAGKALRIPVPPGSTRLEVVTPEGERHVFEPRAEATHVEFSDTRAAGPYRVLAKSEGGTLRDAPRGAFVVESPGSDSDLRPAPLETHRRHTQATAASEVRRSVAAPLFLACALLMVAEGVLRLIRR